MSKICTSIEQSQKLIELGINTSSADMCYDLGGCEEKAHLECDNFITYFTNDEYPEGANRYIPAWSLNTLLGLMPKLYEFDNDPDDCGCQPNLCKGWDNNLWHIVYRSSIYITEWHDEPIDAAFEMVCWLLESHYI